MVCNGGWSVKWLSRLLHIWFLSHLQQTTVHSISEESFIPDLAPHIDRESELDEIANKDKKIYIKSLFIPSFYEPGCDNVRDMIVHPVYFWPGQRIDLRCAMCRRAFTYNGQMKHWWFMSETFVEEELGDKQRLKSSKRWIDMQFVAAKSAGYNSRTSGAMPSDEKGTFFERPSTVFIQRNGLLMILQPTSENEGLYRCVDHASRNTLDFVYYLIAMQPMFIYLKPNSAVTNDQIAGECPSTDGFPDMNWKFRHVPPTFIRDALGMCGQNWTYCIDWILSDKHMNESKSWNLHNRSPNDAHLAAEFVNLKIQFEWSRWTPCGNGRTVRTREGKNMLILSDKHMNESKSWNLHNRSPNDAHLAAEFVNLKIQFEWSRWTPCGNGRTVRTREGHCYLRKIDPKKDIEQLSDKAFEKYDLFEWANRLKNRLKAVDEFARIGIRLYSGILAKVIALSAFRNYGSSQEYDDCYTVQSGIFSRDYAYAKDRWIDSVLDAFGIKSADSLLEMSDRLCLHYYRKPRSIDDQTSSNVLLGSHVIENQECPVQSGIFSRDYAYAKDRWIDSVLDAFGIKSADSLLEMSDRLCLHYYRKPRSIDDQTSSNVLLGSHVIENQECPV
uniref:Ig-like domain-containing protein n=1 Tax=Ascaris lumbricoides TaxID=6252 RepID=A0A0M3I1A4_ASCLU